MWHFNLPMEESCHVVICSIGESGRESSVTRVLSIPYRAMRRWQLHKQDSIQTQETVLYITFIDNCFLTIVARIKKRKMGVMLYNMAINENEMMMKRCKMERDVR